MIAFIVLLAVLFIVVVGVEMLARSLKIPLEATRKATHILTGVIVALSAHFVTQPFLIVLAIMFIIVIAVSRKRGIFRSIHDPERSGAGDLWYPIGILLAAVLFTSSTVFTYTVLILAVSDGLAGLIGRFYGKRKIKFIRTSKTYVGSGVFFVTAFGLSLLIMPPLGALIAAAYLALIELVSTRGNDNLFLPVAAGILALVFGA